MTTTFRRFVAGTVTVAAVVGAGVSPATAAPKSSITMTLRDGAQVVQTPVSSFSWGASNPVQIGGGSAGKVSFSSFNLMRDADALSPELYRLLATSRKVDGADVEFANGTFSSWYCMDGVYVESAQQSASAGSARPTESISLAYESLTVKVGMSSFSWNLAAADPTEPASSRC